jgi:hypothetical protein
MSAKRSYEFAGISRLGTMEIVLRIKPTIRNLRVLKNMTRVA